MKMIIKYIAAITLMCIFFTAGIFGPELITAYSDENILEKVKFKQVELQEAKSNPDTLILQRIELLKEYPEDVNKVELEIGTNYDMNTVSNQFFEEIAKLVELGLLPETEQTDKTTLKIDVSFYVQKDAPSVNAVLWNILLGKDGFYANCYMDDDTGKIIQIIAGLDKPFNVKENAIETWAQYLGVEAKDINSQPKVKNGYSNYYFNIAAESEILPYVFYHSENKYGFQVK